MNETIPVDSINNANNKTAIFSKFFCISVASFFIYFLLSYYM